jgi:hypothetical protein
VDLAAGTKKDAKQSGFVGLKNLTELYIVWAHALLLFLQAANGRGVQYRSTKTCRSTICVFSNRERTTGGFQ